MCLPFLPVGVVVLVRLPASIPRALAAISSGGLRLREGYMPVHRRTLERLLVRGDGDGYANYLQALFDTFGNEYVDISKLGCVQTAARTG